MHDDLRKPEQSVPLPDQDLGDEPDTRLQGRVGAGPKLVATIANIFPGGLWLLAKIDAAGNSRVSGFVWRHHNRLMMACVAMVGTSLLSAALGRLGLLPGDKLNALSLAVAVAIAGVLAMSPRLCSGLWSLAFVVKSAITTILVTIGAGVAAVVVFWGRLDPEPSWTLNETVAHLRAGAPRIASCLLGLWVVVAMARMVFGGFRSTPISLLTADFTRSAAFDYEMAARHEAAHALVACVLDIPITGAWVLRIPDARGNGGAVTIGQAPAAGTAEALYSLLARRVAVSVAGVAGARAAWSMDAILGELEHQRDWAQAREAAWLASSIHSHRNLMGEVLNAIVPALRTKSWQDAIEEAAKVLLRANGDSVTPNVFAATAQRFGLALPSVEEIASAAP